MLISRENGKKNNKSPWVGKIHWRRDRLSTPVFLGFWVAQLVKSPPARQETWVQSLGWEEPWRRERLPTPVFWPGEFHGLYSPGGHKESETTKWLSLTSFNMYHFFHAQIFPISIMLSSLTLGYLFPNKQEFSSYNFSSQSFIFMALWSKKAL